MTSAIRIAAILAGSALLGAFAATIEPSEPGRLTFLSVGQGDCAVLQTEGRAILIDAGPKTAYSDAGKRLVVPGLRRLGVDNIDLVLISHPDADHIGGLASILRNVKVAQVAVPSGFRQDPKMIEELKGAGCDPKPVLCLNPRQSARFAGFKIDIACP